MIDNTKRNQDICKLIDARQLSYELIAQKMETTRNVVAGVAFRRRHPYKARLHSPNSHGRNKIGHGFKPASYQPKKTAQVAL